MNKKIIIVLIIICFGGLIYSIYNIFIWKKDLDINEAIKSKTIINIVNDDNEEVVEDNIISLSELKQNNPDTVAYLVVNGTDINYVVVKSDNNEYYLNHNFSKKNNSAGWIFMDYRNKFDSSDKNTIIYGHNMKNGSMFGTLKRVLNKDWQTNEDNLTIKLLTLDGINLYQVFSTYKIEVEDFYLKTNFLDDSDYQKFLNTLKKRSNYNYHVELDSNDKILTLSTCTGNGNKRVVLHAKLIG